MRRLAAIAVLLSGCFITIEERTKPLVCPVALGDEDGDCIDNDEDLCPAVPNAFNDADDDGVGDACDPHAEPIDSFDFDSFDDPAIAAARWRDGSPAPWQFVAGSVRHDDIADTGLLQRTMPITSDDTTFDVTFIFRSWPGDPANTMPDIFLATRLDGDANVSNGHSCRLDPIGMGDMTEVALTDATGIQARAKIIRPDLDMVVRIRLQRTVDALGCEVTMGNAEPVRVVLDRAGRDWPTSRHVSVEASRAAVTLEHATIFALR